MDEIRQVEQDIENIEDDCKNINCNPIKKAIIDFFILVKDVFKFFILCKKRKDE